MHHHPVRSTLLCASVLLTLAGCAGDPAPRSYVLGPAAATIPIDMRVDTTRPVLEVKPVSVPDYLDSTSISIRQPGQEIVASRTGRWAERLSLGVVHALTADLAIKLPDLVITATPADPPAARQLLVDILQFETTTNGRCILTARWSIINNNGSGSVHSERDSFTVPAASLQDADIAVAMSNTINELAARISPFLR